MSKTYSDQCPNYNGPPCAQFSQGAYANQNINNSNYINHNQLEMMYGGQISNRSQYSNIHPNANIILNVENTNANWFTERATPNEERAPKHLDKIENIEITSKDLSPASFCSNLDLILPDFYKNLNKDTYNSKNQPYSGSYVQRIDFPSCAEINPDSLNIPKDNNGYYSQQYYKNTYSYQDFNTYEYCMPNQMFGSEMQFAPLPNMDQAEGSNEDSDIIVEDSEEETDYNDLYNSRCVICSCFYVSNGIQFYLLTDTAPLTMSTQKPLNSKIKQLLGPIKAKQGYLCSQCLGLINTIDHLQFKLDNFLGELRGKLHTNENKKKYPPKKAKFKDICKHKFRCKLCKKIYSLGSICNIHIKKHMKYKQYLCDVCGVKYNNNKVFEEHLKLHYDTKKEKSVGKLDAFSCKVCNLLCRTKSKLKEHQNYCLGRLPYKCKYLSCNKKFTTSTKLKYHVKLKHDKKFTSICSICNIGFIRTSDYKSHMVSHSTDKKYQCSICQRSYKTLGNLNFHMKFHAKSLPFCCKICKKEFMRKDYLESHLNTHNGIKKFTCYVCDGKFVSQKYLDAHVKCHDKNTKRKTCNLCGKSTANLQEHLRRHNNLKEYSCNECDMKFNTRSAMYKHRKRKHK